LSGAHLTLFPKVVEELAALDASDIVVFGGGIIPEADIDQLEAAGIAHVFGPGTSLEAIQVWVDEQFTD
jgi:methylmalonyl-CoA mutase C-terminal domain/subunit